MLEPRGMARNGLRQRRNRTRLACIPCQIRKRKCSGTQPCSICAHLKSDCQYGHRRRERHSEPSAVLPGANKSSAASGDGATTATTLDVDHAGASSNTGQQQPSPVEVNSGAVYAKKLGLQSDLNLAPTLNIFAWNLGLRRSAPSEPSLTSASGDLPMSLASIISRDEMRFLAEVYFEKIDLYYPFLDRTHLTRQMEMVWPPGLAGATTLGLPEAILCGVAALGCLFSDKQPSMKESQLLETARVILDHHNQVHTPSIELITAWVLRVSYLRIAGTPHPTWLASCHLMHLLEAAGLHLEGCSAEQAPPPSGDGTLVIRRKLYAIGCHFNLWMSFELGRTRVKLPTATTKLPLADLSNEQEKRDIFSFLALSESLDHEHRQSVPELEQALLDIMSIQDLAAPMILTQCNLMLCVIRRLQYLGFVLSGSVLDGFAQVARKGLRATRQNVVGHSPWHQVANVPFQIICTLLSMDNQVAMGLLPDAVQTLREVATAYDTDVMREAASTAILLVKMHQRRKEQDAKALSDIVMAAAADDAESRNKQITNDAASAALLQNDSLTSDLSAQWWPQDSFLGLGLEGLPLDPLLMMQDSWPAPAFE